MKHQHQVYSHQYSVGEATPISEDSERLIKVAKALTEAGRIEVSNFFLKGETGLQLFFTDDKEHFFVLPMASEATKRPELIGYYRGCLPKDVLRLLNRRLEHYGQSPLVVKSCSQKTDIKHAEALALLI